MTRYGRNALGTRERTTVHLNELASGATEFRLQNWFTRVQIILETLDELEAFARLVYETENEDGDKLPPLDIERSTSSVQCVREASAFIFTFDVDSHRVPELAHLLVVVLQEEDLGDFIGGLQRRSRQGSGARRVGDSAA